MVVLGIKESKSNKLRQGFIVNVFFWKQVAFYNFVQRPMKKIGNLKENPKEKDSTEAVPLFEEVLKILKPHYVLFMSKIASEHLGADEEPIVKQINGNEVIIFYLDDPSRLNEKKLFKIKEDFKRLKENAENFYNTIEKNWQESFLFIPSKITKIGNYIFERGEKDKSPPRISFSIYYDGQKQETNENYKDLENYSFMIEYSVGEGDFEDDEDFYYGLCLVNDDNANNYRVKFKNNEVLFRDKWYGPSDSWLCWKYIKPETLVYLYENDSFKQKKAIEDMMQDVANLLEELAIR